MLGTTLAQAMEQTARRVGPDCNMKVLRAELSDADRETLDEMLADPSVQHSHIARALKAIEHPLNVGTINRHRRGDCACSR